jgi:hypothetical protein
LEDRLSEFLRGCRQRQVYATAPEKQPSIRIFIHALFGVSLVLPPRNALRSVSGEKYLVGMRGFSVDYTFLSVLSHFYILYSPYLFLECLLKICVWIIGFFYIFYLLLTFFSILFVWIYILGSKLSFFSKFLLLINFFFIFSLSYFELCMLYLLIGIFYLKFIFKPLSVMNFSITCKKYGVFNNYCAEIR